MENIKIKQIRDIIYQIFSENGYLFNNMNVKFPQPLNISITKNNEDISLDFMDNCPKVSLRKIITFTAYINGLALGPESGVLKLKYFPDIKFSYDKTQELLYGNPYDFSSIEQEILLEYQDEARQKLATKCLQYGREWATIASRGNPDFASSSPRQQKELKKQCKEFILENIREEERHGSVVLTFILLYVLLPVILKFILERLFNRMFS
jgi:hypothetical protein